MSAVQTNIWITSHQISCIRGTDGEGGRNQKIKKHSQDSHGCILRMLVAQREHHRQESVPTWYTRTPMSLPTWFHSILRYVEEGHVTMIVMSWYPDIVTFSFLPYVQLRTVPNAIITDDTQPRTPNQSSMVNNDRYVQWWLFGYICTWRWQAT